MADHGTLGGSALAELAGFPQGEGFEEALTRDPDPALLAALAADALASQDYCVVQFGLSEDLGRRAFSEGCSPLMKYKALRKEMEGAYLGQRHGCKAAFLGELAEDKERIVSALDQCDFLLSTFTKLLAPLSSVALEFVPYSRTHGMVRVPFQSSAEQAKFTPFEVDDEDIAEGVVDEHITFLKRRHLCMLFVVHTEGGELTLLPKDDDRPNIPLETQRGQLIVFRHDRMTYSYAPRSSTDLVLQAWVLSEPDRIENLNLDGEDQAFKDEIMGLVSGPNTPGGERIDTIGIAVCFPAGGHVYDAGFWNACMAGTDGQIRVPITRFDVEPYFASYPDDWQMGVHTYTTHGGFVMGDIYAYDNRFFDIPDKEAPLLSPAHRCLLEAGYTALFNSGSSRSRSRPPPK